MKRCHFCKGRLWPWQMALEGWHIAWHRSCWHTARKALLEAPVASHGTLQSAYDATARNLNDPEHVARQRKLRAEEEDRL